MPATTWVENGCIVGVSPTGHEVRVPLADCARSAGVEIGADDEYELSTLSGATIDEALMGLDDDPVELSGDDDDEEIGARSRSQRKARRTQRRQRIKKRLKKVGKAIKKVAKSKIFKGLAKIISKVTPPPFSLAITAAKGAAKFAKMVKRKRGKHPRIKQAVAAVRLAAGGKLTGKQLSARARKLGFDPKLLNEAAVIKRVALQARTNPKAAATLRLAKDITSTSPLRQDLALAAAAQAQAGPNARAFVVTAPGGQTYNTLVTTGS